MSLPHSPSNPTPEPRELLAQWLSDFEPPFASLFATGGHAPERLLASMRYSALAGGKRMRPLLVFGAGQALGLGQPALFAIAAAIELIHSYSLIHDDLPAMDDDDLRRGQASNHRQFDEATAILAGDALQALAFEVLASDPILSQNPSAQMHIIREIASACGAGGMAGGQMLDLAAIDQTIDYRALETMHRLKTGALIRVCVTAPAHLTSNHGPWGAQWARYGEAVGLAFQIHDDVLDVTASSQDTGKPVHADAARNKPAFPSVLGMQASQAQAQKLCAQAIAELEGLPGDTHVLRWLAEYAIHRSN